MSVILEKTGALEYLRAENIAAAHCFTTRFGGVSTGHLASMNIGVHRGDDPANVQRNYQILADALGFDLQKLVLTRQTHSDIVRKVTLADAGKGLEKFAWEECDALITADPGVTLAVFTADCTPILLHDPVTRAVGAVHAGWRGTAAGLAAKTAKAMVESFGCRPENICAAIGPNIGRCCFETDADVPNAILAVLPQAAPYIINKGNKFFPDLKQINALWLRQAGVTQIDISTHCTACDPRRFWSHRITGDLRGSQGALIQCGEVQL